MQNGKTEERIQLWNNFTSQDLQAFASLSGSKGCDKEIREKTDHHRKFAVDDTKVFATEIRTEFLS